MKLTETRKAIIEFIETFMDKVVDRWCLIKYWDWYAYVYNVISNWKKTIVMTHWVWDMSLDDIEFDDDYQIIWCYEMTAVSKFIMSTGFMRVEFYDSTISISEDDWYNETQIPSKPLHLYTEEEDKQLLKILTNLVKND